MSFPSSCEAIEHLLQKKTRVILGASCTKGLLYQYIEWPICKERIYEHNGGYWFWILLLRNTANKEVKNCEARDKLFAQLGTKSERELKGYQDQ